MSNFRDYYNELKKTRPCVNGVPMASSYEAFMIPDDDNIERSETVEQLGFREETILEVVGAVNIYVDGQFVYGPVMEPSVITVK